MSHAHSHDAPAAPAAPAAPDATRRLAWVLALTAGYTVAEVVGGFLANSLSLIADAGHMMTDNLALSLALAAAWFARRPPDAGRTYGYRRAEPIAALVNGLALIAVCVALFWEAANRLMSPQEVRAGLMGTVAAGGLAVNVVALAILHRHAHGLNVRGARLHVIGDLLGSVGALAAAALVALFGWRWADPVATLGIGSILLVGSLRLARASIHVLMEGVPAGLDVDEVRRCLAATEGVEDVHDLHVWSLAGGAPLLSAHLVVDHTVSPHVVLRRATDAVRSRFGIDHATLQIESPDFNIRGLPDGEPEVPHGPLGSRRGTP